MYCGLASTGDTRFLDAFLEQVEALPPDLRASVLGADAWRRRDGQALVAAARINPEIINGTAHSRSPRERDAVNRMSALLVLGDDARAAELVAAEAAGPFKGGFCGSTLTDPAFGRLDDLPRTRVAFDSGCGPLIERNRIALKSFADELGPAPAARPDSAGTGYRRHLDRFR